ncbi:MAG: Inositol 2-dehydrogenase/D-chiro-inositol 3-dehydrogenase [Verrucomicrobiae bacterium]|nr:Inositol 2-dehydrogenase/D-chiro-inositol 3-dehydrogenase [Verrucomicrobiae bacterium]
MTTSQKVGWGILSTGAISRAFAEAAPKSVTGRLVAVASRDSATAQKFAGEYKIPNSYGRYEDLLTDPAVQAVYISTPHPLHAEWAIKAAQAGKHILCEKPVALNHPDAMRIVAAAQEHGVFLMEAFMYRCHPQTAKLLELLRDKIIGDVRLIQATFSFQCGFNANSRLFSNALGGGGILDVGGYPVSMARLLAGAEPLDVKGVAHLGTTGIDEWATAVLRFPGDILAQVSTGIVLNQENVVRIFGSAGKITLPNPWVANRKAPDTGKIIVHLNGKEPTEISIPTNVTSYSHEIDVVGRAIQAGQTQAPAPAMTWNDTLGNMQTLDRWRESIGLLYDAEKPAGFPQRTLRLRPQHTMQYARVPGVTLPVSRIVLGGMEMPSLPRTAVICDDFFERGGNCFDTAHIYGGGVPEKYFGHWVRNRNLRDQIVIIGKGAHTPFCDPVNLTTQLLESLERMQTDYVDLYIMHRDNPAIPVGEFVDVLNQHLRAGRCRAFGGSNWSLDRVQAANDYARQHGLTGFTAVSNNFSLARMVDPVWSGCISSADLDSRAWFTKTQTALFAWSSQARGFFTERADRSDDKELVRCWFADDNFARRQRAYELANKRGVHPNSIALAYVLRQPFPTFALIGPRTLTEFHSSLPGLTVELSPEELRWLNLE